MNYDLTQFPISPATDETIAIQQLGYFWRRIFADNAAVVGLVQGSTSGAAQNYVDLLDAVSSYSADNIPAFSQTNWYPLTITTADLNQTLTYGENVTYGEIIFSGGFPPTAALYYYGQPEPNSGNIYTVIAPTALKDITIAADHIITPTVTWVAGQNMQLLNNRIYFYGNPIPVGQSSVTLWFYNAQVDAQILYDNFGFLFGLNLDNTYQTKAILSAMVNLLANGPSVANIQQVCVACMNLMNATETVINAAITVEDQCDKKLWWQTDIAVSPNGTTASYLPLVLPPKMFLVGFKQALQFVNAAMPVSYINAAIQFPVTGTPYDVSLFNTRINSTNGQFLTALNNYIVANGGTALSVSNTTAMINPVDFIFRSMLGSTTTLIHVLFSSMAQAALFEQVFGLLRNSLPPYVWLLFIGEVNAANEVFPFSEFGSYTETISPTCLPRPAIPLPNGLISEHAYMNTGSGSGLLIKEMLLRRALPAGATAQDINNLDFTQGAP